MDFYVLSLIIGVKDFLLGIGEGDDTSHCEFVVDVATVCFGLAELAALLTRETGRVCHLASF